VVCEIKAAKERHQDNIIMCSSPESYSTVPNNDGACLTKSGGTVAPSDLIFHGPVFFRLKKKYFFLFVHGKKQATA
jgi:hypothetical protein